MKCPKCNTIYEKKSGDLTYHCSNPECILWYHEHKKFDWAELWRKIRYSRIKDSYYWMKNRFFKRYDLIRTGVDKSSWCDKDHLMLHGMMGLLVDFVEKEEAFANVNLNFNTLDDDTPLGDAILELYIQWKVEYPKLEEAERQALEEYSKSTNMILGKIQETGLGSITFESTEGYSDEDRKQLLNNTTDCETKVYEFEQTMLHRLIDVRLGMWT